MAPPPPGSPPHSEPSAEEFATELSSGRSGRQRIDWPLLVGEGEQPPVWGVGPAPGEVLQLLAAFSELFVIDDTDLMLKRGVELAKERVGLVRAGIYLYDQPAELMLGTWGTALDGSVVDEHHSMFGLGEHGKRVFEQALRGEATWTLIDNCPLIDQRERSARVVGRGWVMCTPIVASGKAYGMMYSDSGATGAAPDAARAQHAAVLCNMLAASLAARRHSNQYRDLPSTTARHPTLRRAVHLLSHDPSLSGAQLSKDLQLSVSRLARLFKQEMGLSLVDYRNRVRLERFFTLVGGDPPSLTQAALQAGFGSYAQFHRVFRAMRGSTPSEYLATLHSRR